MGRPPLSLRATTLACLGSESGGGDSLRLAVMADVVGVVVSAFRFTPFFLTTGGVGGTTGTMGVAGGGGAAGGGTGTDVTFAVMVGTGVAAMTGVWDTVGGMFWKGVAGETEDTAATCWEPAFWAPAAGFRPLPFGAGGNSSTSS